MKKHIMFVGGGTAGHIAPLLAVMGAVQERAKQVACSYVGQQADLASPLITESTLTFSKHAVHSGKLHRHLTWNQFSQLRSLLRGMREAERLIRTEKPDVVFAKGGYSTVPVVVAAARARIPVFCHESDAVPGLANRFIARFARKVFTSYPVEAYRRLPAAKLVTTGQPVRDMFYRQARELPLVEGKRLSPVLPVITVVGGSQGARQVNMMVAAAWEALLVNYQIVHITGVHEHAQYEKRAAKLPAAEQERLNVVPFLTGELPALFQKSAVVVSRAGGTIAELAACRACTVLIPLSTAAQNHQWANARLLESAGAAVVLDERTTTADELVATIRRILQDTREQTGLRAAIGSFDHPDAAARMADYLLEA